MEALYRRYGPMVLRRCRSILRSEERALDAMQEVFVQVLRRRESLRADYPSSLLYRIATNTSLNALRSQRRAPLLASERTLAEFPVRDEAEERILAGCLLERLFAAEKPSTRRIAELHYVEEATLQETARRSGLSVSGVRKRLRGLRARGRSLGPAGPGLDNPVSGR